jgi:hypothetical protein
MGPPAPERKGTKLDQPTRTSGGERRSTSESAGDPEQTQPPDVNADRLVPASDAPGKRGPDAAKKPPLAIRDIENLEDDAKGG